MVALMDAKQVFAELDLQSDLPGVFAGEWLEPSGPMLSSYNPATGEVLARVATATPEQFEQVVSNSVETFDDWSKIPAPTRGDWIRQIADQLRQHKTALGALVSLETGKIPAEGEGEIQEMIDLGELAVGLSRQLYGLTMTSERPQHRMYEQWHPLGPVGIISAFNFPAAVWSWNALIAAVCGDTNLWKPASQTPLTAIAITKIVDRVMRGSGYQGVFNLLIGSSAEIGDRLVDDRRIPLISATGSCRMGYRVGERVAARMGRSLLELGGNNAAIVMNDADLDLAVRGILFAAVGTAGQRCTSLRRLLLQHDIASPLLDRLLAAYQQIRIGNPADQGVLMGPLINTEAVENMQQALEQAQHEGGEILWGGRRLAALGPNFVEPAIVRIPSDAAIVTEETFAPILYVMEFEQLKDAIVIQNGVSQGLSSSIFTDSVRSAETFLSSLGSDCGIANVNIGTSGAEIGGAFGGEKDTGGGREAGSDAWKAYMRRQTTTINWGEDLPLSQGIEFS